MQTLKGSEKQVKWASEIRDEAIAWSDANVKILENEGLPDAYAQEMRRLIEKAMSERTEAKYWIDSRKTMTGVPAPYEEEISESLQKEIPTLRMAMSDKYSIVWCIRGLKKSAD